MQLVTPWHKNHRRVWYLEYDGNSQTVTTSNRLTHLSGVVCQHFSTREDLGDPFWKPSSTDAAQAADAKGLKGSAEAKS